MKFNGSKLIIFTLALFLLVGIIILFKEVTQKQKLLKLDFSNSYGDCVLSNLTMRQSGDCLVKLASQYESGYSRLDLQNGIQNFNSSEQKHWCHEFLHYVGWQVYKTKKNLPDSFASAIGSCDNGMYHGIMEEYIKESDVGYDTDKFAKEVIPHACDSIISSKEVPKGMAWTCYHGLGHAFMYITENDLVKSLALCDRINGSGSQGCYTGSLMENISTKQVGKTVDSVSKYAFNGNDPNYPCNIIGEKYKNYCFLYKGSAGLTLENGDFEKAFKDCLKVDSKYQSQCFYGVGSDAPSPQVSSSEAAKICLTALDASPEAYKQCILGSMAFLPELNLGDMKAAVDFCNGTNIDYKELCYKTAGKEYSNWVTPENSIEQKCALFLDSKAVNLCLHPDEN